MKDYTRICRTPPWSNLQSQELQDSLSEQAAVLKFLTVFGSFLLLFFCSLFFGSEEEEDDVVAEPIVVDVVVVLAHKAVGLNTREDVLSPQTWCRVVGGLAAAAASIGGGGGAQMY